MESTVNQQGDGLNTSPWQRTNTQKPANVIIYGSDQYDVLIVGAGITGMTAGLLLQNAGKKVLIAEARKAGFGATGGTTAHINTLPTLPIRKREALLVGKTHNCLGLPSGKGLHHQKQYRVPSDRLCF